MSDPVINGTCSPGFEAVRDEFIENFKSRGEVGASVCVIKDGETVVDLWGGVADRVAGRPWEQDTKCVVWSTTKAMPAMCIHVLVDRGALDLFAPVTDYWPEYGQNGKEGTLVAHFLNHQAGLCVVTEEIPERGIFDWDLMVGIIERQAPQFAPGTMVGYSALMYGWLLGELIRRVSGKSMGTFFREEIAGPLGADCWMGLPEELENETARVLTPEQPLFPDVSPPGYEVAEILFRNSGGYLDFTPKYDGRPLFDTPEAHRAEIGGGGGIANGRGLAHLYGPWANGGSFGGVDLIGQDTLDRAQMVVSAISTDFALRIATRWTYGFMKSWDNSFHGVGSQAIGGAAFGYLGFGGSIGFADPEAGISYGYTMNRMGVGMGLMDSGQSLVDATYRALGYRSRESGEWRR